MSDLISRSKLIMRLSDYALQESPNDNESTGEQRISKMIYDAIQNCISCVEEQPTAYSVDGVVEELEERKALHERLVDYETKNGTVTEKYQHIKAIDILNDAIEIIKQEAEQCNNDWIACSERLPEESGYYLVTYHDWSDGNFLPRYDDTYVRRLHYQISDHFVGWNYPKNVDDRAENDCHKEVIAWQPLPEPFKERD